MPQFVLRVNDRLDKLPTLREAIRAAKHLVSYNAILAFMASEGMAKAVRYPKAGHLVLEVIGHLWVEIPGEWPRLAIEIVEERGMEDTITLEKDPCLDYPVFNAEPERPPSVPPES